MVTILGDVLVDGVPREPRDASVPVFDMAVSRGFGCFEVLRVYDGVPFRTAAHLERLASGAAALGIRLPAQSLLSSWIDAVATGAGDARVRVLVTGGSDEEIPGQGSRVFVYAEALPLHPDTYRLLPVVAPWHSAGHAYSLTGVKSLSYAPNLAATFEARAAGYDDALLVGIDDEILEGPTYAIGWVRDGIVETPGMELGILSSITRHVVAAAAAAVGRSLREVVSPLDVLEGADEAFVMSTVLEVGPVVAVGGATLSPGPVTTELAKAYAELVAAETGR